MTHAPTLVLVDGSGFIFRAYHSLPPLTRPDGTPVGAVYGFLNMLLKLREQLDLRVGEDALAVIFDAARVTFRNRIYAEYKAHRPPAPEDLVPQFPLVRAATEALDLPAIELADFEADDLIASYAKAARAEGKNVIIVSSDKDLMQLISDGVSLWDPMKQKPIGPEQVMEKFGVPPAQVIEVQALIGDSSDNVPGVPSIGPKTAAELIQRFGTLEALLARTAEIPQPKRRETIENNADLARISKELVTLKDDVALPLPLDALGVRDPDKAKLLAFAVEQNFKTLITRLGGSANASVSASSKISANTGAASAANADVKMTTSNTTAASTVIEVIRDEAALTRWLQAIAQAGVVAFDTETTSLDATQAELVGVSLSVEPGRACYIPLGHVVKAEAAQTSLFGDAPDTTSGGAASYTLAPGQLPRDRAIALIKPMLEDAATLKIGHNIKYDMVVMENYGVKIAPVDDTMLLSYVCSAGLHGQGMDELAERLLQRNNISYDSVTGTGKARLNFSEVEIEKAAAYAAEDADVTLMLHRNIKPRVVEQKLLTLYETIERPLIPVIVAMERAGIAVDTQKLTALSADFAARMAVLEREAHTLAGTEFLISSPKQLGEILFDRLKLSGAKKNAKSGTYNTSAELLEELAEQHPLPAKVLEWRQLAKLKSTYTDALVAQVNPATGRVHTSYAMAITSTGRLSSSDPNLQNIPIRTEEGRKLRDCFIARPGTRLISADYSQIELRLLAHVADIPALKTAFKDGRDIHAATAAEMFGVPLAEVNGELRRRAKTINFGIIYGISAHGLAARLGISRTEAAEYIARYFERYPGIQAYMERAKQEARTHGYVTTLFGRRCHVPGIHDKNPNMRAFSERAAINAPLQGSAADIIKRAMITLNSALQESGRDATMLLQVHDELVLEVAERDVEYIMPLTKKIMEHAAHLSLPLVVEVGSGPHWGAAH